MKVLLLCVAFAAVGLAMPVGDDKSELTAPVLLAEAKPEEPKPIEEAKPLPEQKSNAEVDKKEEKTPQESSAKNLAPELKPPTEEDKEKAKEAIEEKNEHKEKAKEAIEEKNEQESEAKPSEKTAVKSLPALDNQEPAAEAKISEPTPETKPIEESPIQIIPRELTETSSVAAPIAPQENTPVLEPKATPVKEPKTEIVEATVTEVTVTEVTYQPELKSAPIETVDVISTVKIPAAVADEISKPADAKPENAAKTSLPAETTITNSVPSVEEKPKSVPEPELPAAEVVSNAVPTQPIESKPETAPEPDVVIPDIKDSTAAPTEDILRVIRDTIDEKDKSNVAPKVKKTQGEEQKEQAEEVSEKKSVESEKSKQSNEVPPTQQAKLEKPCSSTPSSINTQKGQYEANVHLTSTASSSLEDSESNEKLDENAEKAEERRKESENDGISEEKKQD